MMIMNHKMNQTKPIKKQLQIKKSIEIALRLG